jgi:hypothetical protein
VYKTAFSGKGKCLFGETKGRSSREKEMLMAHSAVLRLTQFNVRRLITAVLLLTVADIVLTLTGLHHGYLAELNPLMRFVLESPVYLKYVLPCYLLLCFAVLYYHAEAVRWLGPAVAALALLKIAVLLKHLAIIFLVFTG